MTERERGNACGNQSLMGKKMRIRLTDIASTSVGRSVGSVIGRFAPLGFGMALTGAVGYAFSPSATSLALRAASALAPSAARRQGVRVSLGPRHGEWVSAPLWADIGPTLSEIAGYTVEAAVVSRFGGFPPGSRYSRFLDPSSPLFASWLGAYIVFDEVGGQRRRAFGFNENGGVDEEEVLDLLEADKRLVQVSTGNPRRFENGRVLRPIGEVGNRLESWPITVDGVEWLRLTGESDGFSPYATGKDSKMPFGGRLLYGGVPEKGLPRADGRLYTEPYELIRFAGEIWLRYDEFLRATVAGFLVAPLWSTGSKGKTEGKESVRLGGSEPLLVAARSLLRGMQFNRAGVV